MPMHDDSWDDVAEGDRPRPFRSPLISRRGGGRLLDEGAEPMEPAGDPFERLRRRDDGLFQALELVRLDARRNEASRKAFDEPEGLLPGFAESQLSAFDGDAEQVAARAPSAEARALFLKGAAAARRRHMDRLAELEGGMLATKRRVEVESEIARLADSARADPDGYDAAEANLRLLLDAAEGLTRPERAAGVRAEAEARLAESMLAGLIERDRLEEAEERLGRDDAPVDAGRKARLQRRLAVAHGERAAKQAMQRAGRVLELERRARSGETDEDEIGRAFADGDVAEARRDGLLALARSAAERKERRRAGRELVAERLAAGQAFDPARDRRAVEAYYDALLPALKEAGADDDAFLREATDLVARTGVWPGRFRTFVETQLDAGQHAAIAAKALARLHATAPSAVVDVARGHIAFAAAAARLIDGGIAAETALARARPMRGLPGAEDAELRAAQAFELRPHYKDWLEREPSLRPLPTPRDDDTDPGFDIKLEPGDDTDPGFDLKLEPGDDDIDPGHDLPPRGRPTSDEDGDHVAVTPALIERFGRSFEDWFFRTGDASLSRGLAIEDVRAEMASPDSDRLDNTEPDTGLGGCPDVHRPGWACDGEGRWRPKTPDEPIDRNLPNLADDEPIDRNMPFDREQGGVDLNREASDAGGGAGDGGGSGGGGDDDSRSRRPGGGEGSGGDAGPDGPGAQPAPGAPAPGDEPRPSQPGGAPGDRPAPGGTGEPPSPSLAPGRGQPPKITDIEPRPPETLAPDLVEAMQRNDLNPDWMDEIAKRETGGQPHDGWGTVRRDADGNEALGRFQMTEPALKEAGLKDENGDWTGKYGINSREDFLNNPEAQKAALNEYTKSNDRQLTENGAKGYRDQKIEGIKGEITVTDGGLQAAAHLQGAKAVRDYLEHQEAHGWRSDPSAFPEKLRDRFLSVETRLREFQGVSTKR